MKKYFQLNMKQYIIIYDYNQYIIIQLGYSLWLHDKDLFNFINLKALTNKHKSCPLERKA